ncbi:hypothetical protein [Streptomyces genisteinicus]|uniref:Uncharacterized protein n=1 Tax=Streptomyces genisteinicus TaxID=2768068 RepID=A0A7H0I0M6_9ACTN|nr:hypothetical protein [Streptomyces genisteinicus]QNP66342.1 hypothetical protein IAG43_27705 [Streptomyces genisteinicus]
MTEGTGNHFTSNVHGGDNVNIYGGTGNQGIVHHHAPAPALAEAVARLEELVAELRGEVGPGGARVLDSSLPAITSDATPPQTRRDALVAVSAIAATAGELGRPVVDAVTQVLALLGLG